MTEIQNGSPTMPPTIAASIVQVMSQIKQLGYDDTNKFQGYQFASIDKFLSAVGPLMAAAGLFILSEEMEADTKEGNKVRDGKESVSNWLCIRWAYTLGHADGSLYGPLHRTVMVPASGAQAYGSAQSYSLKQFLRGLLMIATGDKDDADANEKQPLPASRERRQRSEFPDKGRRAGGEPVTDAPSTRAAAPSPPAFDWKAATPEARTAFILEKIKTRTLDQLAYLGKETKEKDVGSAGYASIMRAITDREKAMQGAQQHVTDDAVPALRQLRELFLDVATTTQDLDIAAQTWEDTTEAGPIRTRGEELIAARREAIA